jgi:outer membrane protein assembly factor BamD (BamD/ComL family)
VDRARDALKSHDSAAALRALDEHRSRFPGGALTEEAEVARVEALLQAGNASDATSHARAFLKTHPGSAYERRVRALLRDAESARGANP